MLANTLKYAFFDTDVMVEMTHDKKAVSEIFQEYGQDYFRNCESEVRLLCVRGEGAGRTVRGVVLGGGRNACGCASAVQRARPLQQRSGKQGSRGGHCGSCWQARGEAAVRGEVAVTVAAARGAAWERLAGRNGASQRWVRVRVWGRPQRRGTCALPLQCGHAKRCAGVRMRRCSPSTPFPGPPWAVLSLHAATT